MDRKRACEKSLLLTCCFENKAGTIQNTQHYQQMPQCGKAENGKLSRRYNCSCHLCEIESVKLI